MRNDYSDDENYVLRSMYPDLDHDDLRILDRRIIPDEQGNAKAYSYHLLLSSDDNPGVWTEFVEIVMLAKLDNIPKELREKEGLMETHDDILHALWKRDIFFLTLMANIMQPRRLGLLYCYGVRRLAPVLDDNNYEEALQWAYEIAMEHAQRDFDALLSLLTGNYKQCRFRSLTMEEASYLRDTLESASNLQILRGIPKTNRGSGQGVGKNIMGSDPTPRSKEQNEELLRGMMKHQFAMLILTTPIYHKELNNHLENVAREFSRYKSLMQRTISHNAGLSMPMVFAGNLSASLNHTTGATETDSSNLTYSSGTSHAMSQGITVGDAQSHQIGVSDGASNTVADSATKSYSLSEGQAQSVSQGTSDTSTVSRTVGQTNTQTIGQTVTDGQTVSSGRNFGTSQGISETQGTSHGFSRTATDGVTSTNTTGQTLSSADSVSRSNSTSTGQSYNYGESENISRGASHGTTQMAGGGNTNASGTSHQSSVGSSTQLGTGVNTNIGLSTLGPSVSAGGGFQMSTGGTTGESTGNTNTTSNSSNWSNGSNTGQSISSGEGVSRGWGQSQSQGITDSRGHTDSVANSRSHSDAQSRSISNGESVGTTNSTGRTNGASQGTSFSNAISHSIANSMSQSASQSISDGQSQAHGTSQSVGNTTSQSQGVTSGQGQSVSQGVTKSLSQSAGNTHSTGQSLSRSDGTTSTKAEGTGRAIGRSDSVGDGVSRGIGANMGIGPSIGVSKSYTKYDEVKANLVKILEEQNHRFAIAVTRGAYYVEVFIATSDPGIKQTIGALAIASFGGEGSHTSPVQVTDPSMWESEHLLKHAACFVGCTKKETIPGIAEGYEYSTVLLPYELAALTHPPRVETGGAFTVSQNIPAFTMIADKRGEIYLGNQISHETATEEHEYHLSQKELMHILVCGGSGSGKTTTAQRMAKEISQKCPSIKILALDWKESWRILKRFVPENEFNFYSLYAKGVNPIQMNIYVPPDGIGVMDWMNKAHESLCLAYGFGNKQKGVLDQVAEELFLKVGVLEKQHKNDAVAREAADAHEKIYSVTLADVIEKIHAIKIASSATPAGRGMQDAYDSILIKMRPFIATELRDMYCSKNKDEIVRIEDLINGRRVIVLEGRLLDDMPKKFILGLISWGVFLYVKDLKSRELTVQDRLFILEEAHEVFPTGDKKDPPLGVNEDIYQIMLNESREYGLYVMCIAQAPSHLPLAVITNSGILIVHRLGNEEDVKIMTLALARNARMDDRDVPLWLIKEPKGQCVVRINNQWTHQASEPILIKAAPVNALPPDDEEIIEALNLSLPKRMLSSLETNQYIGKDTTRYVIPGFDTAHDAADWEQRQFEYWEQQFSSIN